MRTIFLRNDDFMQARTRMDLTLSKSSSWKCGAHSSGAAHASRSAMPSSETKSRCCVMRMCSAPSSIALRSSVTVDTSVEPSTKLACRMMSCQTSPGACKIQRRSDTLPCVEGIFGPPLQTCTQCGQEQVTTCAQCRVRGGACTAVARELARKSRGGGFQWRHGKGSH